MTEQLPKDVQVLFNDEIWELKPVIFNSQIERYDIYDPDGDWHGSKRTLEQCNQYIYYAYNANKILAARENVKRQKIANQKESKNRTIQEKIDNIDQNEYEKILLIMNDIAAENENRVADARKKSAAQNWFIGQIMKQYKTDPVSIKKVVSDWFEK